MTHIHKTQIRSGHMLVEFEAGEITSVRLEVECETCYGGGRRWFPEQGEDNDCLTCHGTRVTHTEILPTLSPDTLQRLRDECAAHASKCGLEG